MSERDFKAKLDDARARHRVWLPKFAERQAFYEGRQFTWVSSRNTFNESQVALDRAEPWRARTVRNRIFKIVNAEVSAGTNRVPGYEVTPTTTDPEDINAARMAEKVLLYLYDTLSQRRHVANAYRYAVVCGEGFVRPWWNGSVGPALPDDDLHEGQVALDVYGPDRVFWEQGLTFDESEWHAVDQVMTLEKAKRLPGYSYGDDLTKDSHSHTSFVSGQLDKRSAQADSVLVTEYLELPSKAHRKGRRFFVANGRRVTDVEDYPILIEGPQGHECVLHKLRYIETPDRDRDMGLVEQLIDPQRTINDCVNKQIEFKNLALNPQLLVGPGGLIDELTNEPGAVFKVRGDPKDAQWRPVPPIPPELSQMIQQAVEDMEEIAAQRSVPSQVESGKAIAAILEKDDSVRGHIVQNLADFHSRLGRHLLHFVQKHYTEQRLIYINGRLGSEYLDFKGASLRDQVGVRVSPGSIEPRTKAAVEQKVFAMADRQWITRDQALRVINNGTAESLVDDIDLDIGKQQRETRRMLDLTEATATEGDVPVADPDDNHDAHLYELAKYKKTVDYERQEPFVQEAMRLHGEQHRMLKAQAAAEAAQMQAQMAERMGMANAAAPQGAKPLPDQIAPSPNGEGPATPNQPPDQSIPR